MENPDYLGTVFGGRMFGAVDGVHMVMLMKLLGPDYAVWDKGATIRFKHPGTTLYARVTLDEDELESMRAKLETTSSQPEPTSRSEGLHYKSGLMMGRDLMQ